MTVQIGVEHLDVDQGVYILRLLLEQLADEQVHKFLSILLLHCAVQVLHEEPTGDFGLDWTNCIGKNKGTKSGFNEIHPGTLNLEANDCIDNEPANYSLHKQLQVEIVLVEIVDAGNSEETNVHDHQNDKNDGVDTLEIMFYVNNKVKWR